jgi:hypothetical protein
MKFCVDVKNSCRCMLRSDLQEHLEFDSEQEAKQKAEEMISYMYDNFCKKHKFVLVERAGDFEIDIREN